MGYAVRSGGSAARCARGHAIHLAGSPACRPDGKIVSGKPFRERRLLHLLCVSYTVIWIMLAIDPLNRRDWAIENLLVFVAVPVLILTYRRLSLSDTTYYLFFFFLLLHAVGEHYTYAKVPLGFWLKDAFVLEK